MNTVVIIGGPNGAGKTMLVAECEAGGDVVVHNQTIWRKIQG